RSSSSLILRGQLEIFTVVELCTVHPSFSTGVPTVSAFTALAAGWRIVRHHPGSRRHGVAIGELHQLHTLRIPAGNTDLCNRRADYCSDAGNDHHLIGGEHFHQRNHVAGPFSTVDRDDPLTAALLNAVV